MLIKASGVMFDRKSLMSLLIGLTLCVFLWQIMLQQHQAQIFEVSPQNAPDFMNESLTTTTKNTQEIQLDELPKNDYSQLIDLENFEFLINHRACKDLYQQPMIVIMVHSAPDNFNKRKVIRETWGREDARALLIFILGAVNSTNLQDKIDLESKVHSDLVQGNFEDAYRNLTYKHLSAFKWFIYSCPKAKFMLKTDDDVFVNTPFLYSYLEGSSEQHKPIRRERLLFCSEIARAKVKRTFRSKWRVSYNEFVESYFPNHCPGYSILYSADSVFQLYLEAQNLPYFWIDDVHITGNVASKLNISIAATDGLFLSNEQQTDILSGRVKPNLFPFLFARPNLSEDDIKKLWHIATSSSHKTLNDRSFGNAVSI